MADVDWCRMRGITDSEKFQADNRAFCGCESIEQRADCIDVGSRNRVGHHEVTVPHPLPQAFGIGLIDFATGSESLDDLFRGRLLKPGRFARRDTIAPRADQLTDTRRLQGFERELPQHRIESVRRVYRFSRGMLFTSGGGPIRHEQTPPYSGAKMIYPITENTPGQTYAVPLSGGTPIVPPETASQ